MTFGTTLRAAACALSVAVVTVIPAQAQYPDRAVQIIMPYDAGSNVDLVTRGILNALSKELGQPAVVVNQPGASTVLGAMAVKNARPDGYTIGMLVISTLAVVPNTRPVPFSASDYDYICQVYEAPSALIVAKDGPFKTFADFVAFGRNNPGKLLYGSAGPGTFNHIALAALLGVQGIKGVHVPLASNPAVYQSMARGELMANVDSAATVRNFNNVSALLVLSKDRAKFLPDVPSSGELNVNFVSPVWGGFVAPKGLPAAIKAKLDTACRAAVQSEDFARSSERFTTAPLYRSGPEFAAYAEAERARYQVITKELGLAPK
jgi:tripartite-type tricarboxylate transporter receptor subunit TctC